MKLYLSSYGLGNNPNEMLSLISDNKRAAIIMNAQDNTSPEKRLERLQREIDGLTSLGLEPEELDLREYFNNVYGLKSAILEYGFVWVRGGNVFLLRRAFKQSGLDKILSALIEDESLAYGGFSAGVCILAPTLEGVDLVDPKDDVSIGYDTDVIWDGLGMLDYAIAPHYKSDHPESEDINKYVDYLIDNHILFRALRDGEAILINGTQEKIV